MIYVSGLKHLWSNSEGKVDLTKLTGDNISLMKRYFESINKNGKEYTYLEKVFDSKELDLKNMFKIYKINYQKLGEM